MNSALCASNSATWFQAPRRFARFRSSRLRRAPSNSANAGEDRTAVLSRTGWRSHRPLSKLRRISPIPNCLSLSRLLPTV